MTSEREMEDLESKGCTAPGRLDLILALGLLCLGIVMGLPSLKGVFLSGDDVHLILNHVLVNHPSLSHAWELVTIVHRDMYQPIPLLSFSFDFAIIRAFGLTPFATGPDAGAWVFHLTNVLIHSFSGVLVYALFSRLHRERTIALVLASLFIVHPYSAEVVSWLNGRMMLLATLFSVAALIACDKELTKPRWWTPLAMLALLVLAMASKVRVGLPVLMLILPVFRGVWPRRRWWWVWVGAVAVTAGFAALNVVSTFASEMFELGAAEMQGSRIARTILALVWYFQHYVAPVGLSPWHVPERYLDWSYPGLATASMCLLVVLGATAWSWRYSRIGVLGMLWFFATIASTLPLIPARNLMVAERYVYLPGIGFHWIAASLFVFLVERSRRRWPGLGTLFMPGVVAVSLGVVLLLQTWRVEGYYTSNMAKARRIAELVPEEPGVWEDIGWVHYRNGEYQEAIESVLIELEKHPEEMTCKVYQLVGMSEFRLGRFEDAIASLRKAIEADPDYGKCYSRLGQIYYGMGQYENARLNYAKAIEIMPDYLPAIESLGHTYRKLGEIEEAARQYAHCLELNDFDPVATTALAEIEMERGDLESAVDRLETLLSWQPENITAQTNLGVCYARLGRHAEAMSQYEAVLDRDPGSVTAAINLASLEIQFGDEADAVALLEKAIRHAPTNRTVLVAGHDFLVGLGRIREAASIWAAALQHQPEAPDLTAWYGWTCALGGQGEQSRAAAEKALLATPPQDLARATLSLLSLQLNDPDQAYAHLERLLRTKPFPEDAFVRLRRAIVATGERQPENPWPYLMVSRMLLERGQFEAAHMGFDEFLKRCSDETWRQRVTELKARPAP